MKIIKLAIATVVNTTARNVGSGELRYPVEGALNVSDEEAQRLKENNLLDGDPEDAPEPEDDGAADDDLNKMSVADLHILATKEGVALGDATKKADIVAAIQKHRADKQG